MNERIKALWAQAAETTQGDSWEEQTKFMERYTQLIVRECICQCDDENSQKYIMSHFGFTEKDWS